MDQSCSFPERFEVSLRLGPGYVLMDSIMTGAIHGHPELGIEEKIPRAAPNMVNVRGHLGITDLTNPVLLHEAVSYPVVFNQTLRGLLADLPDWFLSTQRGFLHAE